MTSSGAVDLASFTLGMTDIGSNPAGTAEFYEFTITGASAGDILELGATGANGSSAYLSGVSFKSNAVPEPSTWAMMGLGLAALAFWQRRRLSSSLLIQLEHGLNRAWEKILRAVLFCSSVSARQGGGRLVPSADAGSKDVAMKSPLEDTIWGPHYGSCAAISAAFDRVGPAYHRAIMFSGVPDRRGGVPDRRIWKPARAASTSVAARARWALRCVAPGCGGRWMGSIFRPACWSSRG